MVGIQAYLVSMHMEELVREAQRNRLARNASLATDVRFGGHPSNGSGSRLDPRRTLARIADGLSHAAADTAHWLDPSIEDGAVRRPAGGAAGR